MRKISKNELEEILEKHKKWLNNKDGGEQADLRSTDLSYADLSGIDLRCSYLQYADLRGTDLSGANLQYAGLNNADLQYADLQCANLKGANLQKINLQFVDLSNANLSGTDSQKADLQYANLQCTDLKGAYLRFANLSVADLSGADLSDVDLRYVNLKDTNLSDANLQGAELFYANLKGAERPWLVYMGSIGSRRAETLYFADYDIVHCGCWNDYKGGTLAEFEARVDETYPADIENEEYQRYRTEYLLAINMFTGIRQLYLDSEKQDKQLIRYIQNKGNCSYD